MITPSLRFRRAAWDKMLYFRDKQEVEVSMFAITNADDPLLVEDVRLVPQVCSWTTTDMQEGGIADLIDELTDKGVHIRNISRIWCHTHPGDSPNPSGTDEDTFKKEFGALDWAVMFILAKGGKVYCRFKQNTWPALEMEIDVSVVAPSYDRTLDDAEYERCVQKKTYGNTTQYTNWQPGNRTVVLGGPSSTAPFHRGTTTTTTTNGSTPSSGAGNGHKPEPIWGWNRNPTKKERRYIKLHGTIKGFVHPKGCHLEPLKVVPAQSAAPVKLEKLETNRSLIPYVEESEVYDLDSELDGEELLLDPQVLQAEADDLEQSIANAQDEIVECHHKLQKTMKFAERAELQDYVRELQKEQRENRAELYEVKRLLKAVLENNKPTEQSDEEALKEAYAEYAEREGENAKDEDTELEDLFEVPKDQHSGVDWDATIDFVT